MKLITLNIWGGHLRDPLLNFVTQYRDIDIFCFQEVYHKAKNKISTDERQVSLNIFAELEELLPNHRGFFRPVVDDIFGISMFIKKEIDVLEIGDITIFDNPHYAGRGPTHPRNLQWAKCRIKGEPHYVLNVHGLWNGKGKTDCPERIVQSQRIKGFMETIAAPKILCGDFNLRPDTESLKIIEQGMKNLVQMYNVCSTRTSY